MAFPSENPVLAANLQFMFDGVRGADSAVEALRSALLGVAAVHQSFLLSRNGVSQVASEEALRVAESFRGKSETLLVAACGTPEGCHNDAALAADARHYEDMGDDADMDLDVDDDDGLASGSRLTCPGETLTSSHAFMRCAPSDDPAPAQTVSPSAAATAPTLTTTRSSPPSPAPSSA